MPHLSGLSVRVWDLDELKVRYGLGGS
jgi:hypothetical protein